MGTSDLAGIFQTVNQALVENKELINNADELHHDHGDNMVEIFNVISGSVQKKPGASPASQLKYAGKQLKKNVKSSTAEVYSQGLLQASEKFKDKEISKTNAIDFIQTLLGGQTGVDEPAAQGSDLLSGLLSSLGDQASTDQPAAQGNDLLSGLLSSLGDQASADEPSAQGSDLVSGLLSGLTGGADPSEQGNIDLADVLQIGLGYMQAKQSGSSTMEALTSAVLSKTQMAKKQHRSASGKIVTESLLNAFASFTK